MAPFELQEISETVPFGKKKVVCNIHSCKQCIYTIVVIIQLRMFVKQLHVTDVMTAVFLHHIHSNCKEIPS